MAGLAAAESATAGVPGAPIVFWASDPVAPGQVAMLVGEDLGAAVRVEVRRAADEPRSTPTGEAAAWRGRAQTAEVLQAGAQSVKFVVPPKLEPGVFVYRLSTARGAVTGWLNRPAVWWVQGEQGPAASPGSRLRLFGLNLGPRLPVGDTAGTPARAAVCLRRDGTDTRVSASGEAYGAAAALPADLALGTYELFYHRGQGDAGAWSDPVRLDVVAPVAWATRRVAVTDFGADPGGVSDATEAVRQALAEAAKGDGGVVWFPRGRYRITEGLSVPPGVWLRGESREVACLFWPDLPTPPEALVRGTHRFGLEDLTLYAANYQHVIVADQAGPEAGHVVLRRLRVRADSYRGQPEPQQVDERLRSALRSSTGGGDTVRLGGTCIEVTDCDLYGSGRILYLSGVRGGLVARNTLYNGRWGWYCFSGSDGLVFEDNTLTGADLMSTGGGLNCLDGSTCSQHVWYARNRLRLMHGWDREAMTSDAGGGAYCGPVAAVDGAVTTLAGDPQAGGRSWAGAGFFILDGRGRGQYRRVVALAGRQVTLDRPWTVPPDATSVATLTMLQRRYLFVDNAFSDAGVALQLYGMACEDVCDGNVSARTAGFHNFGMNYLGIQPSWYIQWLGNTITEGNAYRSGHDNYLLAGDAHLGIFALPPSADFATPLTLGCVARGNRLLNNAHLAIGGSDPYNPAFTAPTVQEVVVESNEVTDSDVGISLRRAASGVVLRGNRFTRVREEVRDEEEMVRRAEARRRELAARRTPLAEWDFEAATAQTVPDASGNGFAASVSGTVTPEPGRVGRGARFAAAGCLQVDDPLMFDLPSLTLALWVRPDTVQGRHGLLAKRMTGTVAPFVLSLWDGAIEFEATDEQGTWSFNFRSPPAVAAGAWSHVAAVVEAGQGVILYVNGTEVARKPNPAARMGNPEPLVIGREAWGGVNMVHEPCYFEGLMDEVRVWPRALSGDEVRAEFARAPGTP